MKHSEYLKCLTEMISLAPGYRTITLRNYLAPLEKRFGDKLDPVQALNELKEAIDILISELEKVK